MPDERPVHLPNTNTPPDEESVFSRLMNTRVAQEDREMKRVAVLLVFEAGVTKEEAEASVAKIERVVHVTTEEYKEEFGGPVIYFP